MSKFILVSGPSCAGKSPLHKSLKKISPEWAERLEKVVLYNDRPPRPGEEDGVDYHFRHRKEIKKLRRQSNFKVIKARDDLQAVCLDDIRRILDSGKYPFYEGNTYVVSELRDAPALKDIPTLTIFLSPLSSEEILALKNPNLHINLEDAIAKVMRKKLLRRKQKQVNLLSLPDLNDIETRCQAAYGEMREAHKYDRIIPNHDGEDSENWDLFPLPLGDARRAVQAFVSILEENPLPVVEKWDAGLLE